MPFAVEIFFDASADQELRQLRGNLARQVGVADWMGRENVRPHISLALFEQGSVDEILLGLKGMAAQQGPFQINLTKLESFPSDEGVLYLAPEPLAPLQKMQAAGIQMLQGLSEGWNDYYRPGKMVFHCTLNLGLSPEQLRQSLSLEKSLALPIGARAVGLSLVEVVSGKELGDFIFTD
jgi:2'-5' RNA ligase